MFRPEQHFGDPDSTFSSGGHALRCGGSSSQVSVSSVKDTYGQISRQTFFYQRAIQTAAVFAKAHVVRRAAQGFCGVCLRSLQMSKLVWNLCACSRRTFCSLDSRHARGWCVSSGLVRASSRVREASLDAPEFWRHFGASVTRAPRLRGTHVYRVRFEVPGDRCRVSDWECLTVRRKQR